MCKNTQLLMTHRAARLCNNARNKSPRATSQRPSFLILHISWEVLLDSSADTKSFPACLIWNVQFHRDGDINSHIFRWWNRLEFKRMTCFVWLFVASSVFADSQKVTASTLRSALPVGNKRETQINVFTEGGNMTMTHSVSGKVGDTFLFSS